MNLGNRLKLFVILACIFGSKSAIAQFESGDSIQYMQVLGTSHAEKGRDYYIGEFMCFVHEQIENEGQISSHDRQVLERIYGKLMAEWHRAPGPERTDDQVLAIYNLSQLRPKKKDSAEFKEFLADHRAKQVGKDGFETVDEQIHIVRETIDEIKDSIPNHDQLVAKFHLAMMGSKGPKVLLHDPIFLENVGIRSDRVPLLIEAIDISDIDQQIALIKKRLLGRYLNILSDDQLQKLARRLGVAADLTPEICTLTDAKHFANIFNSDTVTQVWGPRSALFYRSTEQEIKRLRRTLDLMSRPFAFDPDEDLLEQQLDQLDELLSKDQPIHPELIQLRMFFDSLDTVKLAERYPECRAWLRNLDSKLGGLPKANYSWKWEGFRQMDIKFHSGEIENPTEPPTQKMKEWFSSKARNVKLLNFAYFNSIVNWLSDSMPTTFEQKSSLERTYLALEEQRKNALTLKEVVEINNEYIAKVNDILIGYQVVGPFQQCFCQYGPYDFFQRPDVQEDFGITPRQLREMDSVANEIRNSVEEECALLVQKAYLKWFSRFTDAEQECIESYLGYDWSDLCEAMIELHGDQVARKLLNRSNNFFLGKKPGIGFLNDHGPTKRKRR